MIKGTLQSMIRWFRMSIIQWRYYISLASKHRVPPSTAFKRRRYYLSFVHRQRVPVHAISFLPDGFCVRKLADTGISIIDNFCTHDEAVNLINSARDRLKPRGIVVNHKAILSSRRTSETAVVFAENQQDPVMLPILYRGAMLMGLPYNHVEAVYITRYQTGQKFDDHEDFFSGFLGDRLYTILIYLNDLTADQGGETVFDDLNFSVQPKLGRAITWTNKNPDGSVHNETRHAALPIIGDAEKWVIQLWFRRYKMFNAMRLSDHATPQINTGKPLQGTELLPEGISSLTRTHTEQVGSSR